MTSSIPDQLGPFQVLGLLGSGGMGEVFLGRRHGPGGFSRAVVLKRLLPHLARQPSIRTMFLDEARIVAGIRHRNVVQVQELGEDGDQLFIAMEYLEGETLARLVREQLKRAVPPTYREAAYIMAEVAAGLHAAHSLRDAGGRRLNVVHRDVTLANVLLTYAGEVKLIDFGIAKADNRLHQTEPGLLRGTSAYMSPEQVTGTAVDARSDIFSFGVALYELTTRRRLFKRASIHETHIAILKGIARPPRVDHPDYPSALEEICVRCLAVDPAKRYQSSETLHHDLRCVVDMLPGVGAPAEALSRQMMTFFASRIQARAKMLQQLERGGPVSGIVPATSDDAADDDGLKSPVVASASPRLDVTATDASGTTPSSLSSSPSVSTPLFGQRTSRWRLMAFWTVTMAIASLLGFMLVFGTRSNIRQTPSSGLLLTDVQLKTTPSNAAVRVQGAAVGTTPVHLSWPVARGPVDVSIERQGYETHELTVPAGASGDIVVVLRPVVSDASRRGSPSSDSTSADGSSADDSRADGSTGSLPSLAGHGAAGAASAEAALRSKGASAAESSSKTASKSSSRTKRKARDKRRARDKRKAREKRKTRSDAATRKSSKKPGSKSVTPPVKKESDYPQIDDWQDY